MALFWNQTASISPMSVLLPPQLQILPASLPVEGAVNIVVEDGIPIFRASQNRQGPLVN
jgi:hypothetical protein